MTSVPRRSFEGGITDTMRELTGRPAEPFAVTAARYRSLPFTQQTLAKRMRAVWNFAITLFYPGYNLDGLPPQARVAGARASLAMHGSAVARIAPRADTSGAAAPQEDTPAAPHAWRKLTRA